MSNSLDLAAMYEKMQRAEEEKQKKEAAAAKDYNNPDFINMRQGNAYEFRLMFWTSGVPGDRVVPIIEKTVHAVKADDGQYHEITCPSTDYLMGRSGYKACPICNELSKLWDESQKGSAAAKIAYDKYKRKFKGYAVVYVINDPTTPENNGTFKILYVNAIINNFLREEIKGIDKKGIKIEGARPIGFKAYDPSANGKNLLISVTKDGEYNKYTCKFVDPEPDTAEINASFDILAEAFDKLKFDEYYTPYDPDAVQRFYEDVYLEREQSEYSQKSAASTEAPIKDKTELVVDKSVEDTTEDKTEAIVDKSVEDTTEDKTEAVVDKSSGVPDIDAILKDLPM